jgi:hypothetical protein
MGRLYLPILVDVKKVVDGCEKWVEGQGRLGRDDRNFQLCGDGHVVVAELQRAIPKVV